MTAPHNQIFQVGDRVCTTTTTDSWADGVTWHAVVVEVKTGVLDAPHGHCYVTHGSWILDDSGESWSSTSKITERQLWANHLVREKLAWDYKLEVRGGATFTGRIRGEDIREAFAHAIETHGVAGIDVALFHIAEGD